MTERITLIASLDALETAPLTVADALTVPEVRALVDARLRHINAVKEYNTKLDRVKDMRNSGDWTGNVEREYASMNEAYSCLIAKMQDFCDAALRGLGGEA